MKGTRGAAALFSMVLVLATSSQADEPIDETERWVPSIAITSGVVVQGASGSVTTSTVDLPNWDRNYCDLSCPLNRTAPGRPSDSGSSILFAPFVGGQLELMTPGLSQIRGRPRGFVQVGFDVSFGAIYNTALEGDPGDMGAECTWKDLDLKCYTRLSILQGAILGQGSETSLQIKSPIFTAGLGVAFTSELWGRRVRFKPSFQWMRQEVEMSGRTNIPVMTSSGASAGCPVEPPFLGTCNSYQMIYLQADKTLVWNGIGPGIEIEIDTVRAGPAVISLALYASAYYLLGDKDVTITASQTIDPIGDAVPPQGSQPVSSTYTYEQKDWSFRGGVALRFRFLPE